MAHVRPSRPRATLSRLGPGLPAALEQVNVDAVCGVEPFLTAATSGGDRVVASNHVDASVIEAPDLDRVLP